MSTQYLISAYINSFPVASDGMVKYSTITTFLDKRPFEITNYVSIMTSGNQSISLTGDHPIYARKCATDKFNLM